MQAEGDVVRLPVAQEGPLDFATFFAKEHRELFRLLCFVTGNRADAADLMQDAFLKLWERWDRVDRIADPRAYLFRVALNGSRRRAKHPLTWSGRRDSNPRPPPWQGSWDGVYDLRRWTDLWREEGVFVLVQPRWFAWFPGG